MKHWIALAVGVALLADIAAFGGLYYGLGVGSVAPGNSTSPQTTLYNDTSSSAGAITINWVGVTTTQGYPLTSALLAGGLSTTLSFGIGTKSNNNCGGGGGPVWDPGGNDYFYYEVQLFQGSTQIHINATANGIATQGYAIFISENGTSSHTQTRYCEQAYGSGSNLQSNNFNNNEFFSANVAFYGIYPAVTVQVTAVSIGSLCNAFGSNVKVYPGPNAGDCGLAAYQGSGNANCQNSQSLNPNCFGGFSQTYNPGLHFTTNMLSGAASFSIVNSGQIVYNGGTLQVSVSTGYDGPGGYQLQIDTPSARPGGGTVDSSFLGNPAAVANFCNGCIVTWQVPAHASQNTTQGPGWNTWNIVLVASFLNAQSSPLSIAISPIYSPATPVVSYVTGSGATYPLPGDTVTLTINAAPPSANGTTVTQVTVWVVYLAPGGSASQLPPCGNQWVSTGCPNGQALTTTKNGASGVATFTFTVHPPLGDNQIGVEAQSGSATGQPSPIASFTISITPPGCQAGQAGCDPFAKAVSAFASIGPILLVVAIFLVGLFVAVIVPMPKWVAFVLVVGAGIVAVILFPAISNLFLPGAPFGVSVPH